MDSNYIISKQEQEKYETTGEASNRLNQIWMDFIKHLPAELRDEAYRHKFRLKMHKINDQDTFNNISYNLMFDIPEASQNLREKLGNSEDNIIICMQDPI